MYGTALFPAFVTIATFCCLAGGNTIFIDFNYTTANRWAAFCVCAREAACSVAMSSYLSVFRHVFLVLSHKDMHFIKLIKCSVVDMRYMIFFGVIKQSIFLFLGLVLVCCFFYEDLATLTFYHWAHEHS